MKTLPTTFYLQDCLEVGQNLLGKLLIHQTKKGPIGGIIVETESYLSNDPASHSFKGLNKRNQAMFEKGGIAYIYLIYGVHFCFNVVTGPKNLGEAVLIRAIEPTIGLDLMQQNRQLQDIKNLTNGPAKLVQALGITSNLNGTSLISGPIKIYNQPKVPTDKIKTTKRIGISKAAEELMRFYIKKNEFISRK